MKLSQIIEKVVSIRNFFNDNGKGWQEECIVSELDGSIRNLSVPSESYTREYLLIRGLQMQLLDDMNVIENTRYLKEKEDSLSIWTRCGLVINQLGDYLD